MAFLIEQVMDMPGAANLNAGFLHSDIDCKSAFQAWSMGSAVSSLWVLAEMGW